MIVQVTRYLPDSGLGDANLFETMSYRSECCLSAPATVAVISEVLRVKEVQWRAVKLTGE